MRRRAGRAAGAGSTEQRPRRRSRIRTALGLAAVLVACRPATQPTVEFADPESPQELVNAVAGVIPRIERLSGLDLRDVLRIRWQTREAAREYVEARLDHEMPAERLAAIRRVYVALGLLPDTLDLRALLLDLYTEQVLGYYDPRTETLYVIRGPPLDAMQLVLVHELVHALQDQHADIDSLVSQARGNDRQTAAHAALEGHAMVVMFAVLAELAARRELDPASLPNPAEQLAPALMQQNDEFPIIAGAPRVIRETLLFPYVHGADFVHELWRSMAGADRYPAPLDTLLPQSTAQVLRPVERFVQHRREPVELRFGGAPAGWRALREDNFGQLETGIFLVQHSGEAARAAASGWAGDRYVLLEPADPPAGGTGGAGGNGAGPGDGRDVLHWVSLWESAAEADRFAAAVRQAAAARIERRVHVERLELEGLPAVWIVDAPAALDAPSLPRPGVTR
jgi:HPt (histidine-containing phosphotransfer) domain-containing protein